MKKGRSFLRTMKEDDNIVVLLTPAELMHQKAVLICKRARLRSPNTNQWLYKMARETVISSFSGIGIPEHNENDEEFDEAFMGIMAKLIKQQPASQTGTPPLVLPREYKRNVDHQMTFADIQMPATSGVGIIIPPVGKRPQAKREEDLHIAKAFEELEAPQQPGEPNQAYEQRCAAAIWLHNMPMPAFFGYVGVNLQQGDVPEAEYPKK